MIKSILTGLLVASFGISTAMAGDYHNNPSKPFYSYKPHKFKNQGYKNNSYDHVNHNSKIHYGHKPNQSYNDVNYAKVVNVEPVTRMLKHKVPEQTCWNETVRYSERSHSSSTPAIVGGLLGATIGHSLGNRKHKSNRIIKTVALGALGASIGHDISRNARNEQTRYGTEERCEVSYHTRYEEKVVAYNVQYRYRGKTYYTKMDYHPRNTIPVQVNIRPVL